MLWTCDTEVFLDDTHYQGTAGSDISSFIWLSAGTSRMAPLFICYYSIILCTSKGVVSVTAICHLYVLIKVVMYRY